jgi:hypothetical protein
VRAVPRLGELYPGICLTTEEKARKNLSQGSYMFKTFVSLLSGHATYNIFHLRTCSTLTSRINLCPRTIIGTTDLLTRAMLTHVDTILIMQFHL